MAFRTFLSSLGISAPKVETELASSAVRPGDVLDGRVTLQGGGADVRVERLAVELVIRLEDAETSETGWANPVPVLVHEGGAFDLAAGAEHAFPVRFEIPWEMPITHAANRALRGARAAARTVLEIDNAIDRSDFDEIAVHALPAQDMLFTAYERLGFTFVEAEVKRGRVKRGDNQTSPFWQELEFRFPKDYGHPSYVQLETVFIARPDSLDLITGRHGPFPFRYADMTPDGCAAWLDRHLRSHFQN